MNRAHRRRARPRRARPGRPRAEDDPDHRGRRPGRRRGRPPRREGAGQGRRAAQLRPAGRDHHRHRRHRDRPGAAPLRQGLRALGRLRPQVPGPRGQAGREHLGDEAALRGLRGEARRGPAWRSASPTGAPACRAIFVLIAEQAINATQATGWWQGGGNTADLRVMENAFMDRMEKSGFTFVDPEVLAGQGEARGDRRRPEPPAGARDRREDRRRDRRSSGAPSRSRSARCRSTTARSTPRSRTSRRARSGPTPARWSPPPSSPAPPAAASSRPPPGRNALSEAGRQLARDLFAKIGKVWTREQSGARRIALAVKGVDDYARLAAFKNVLVAERARREGRAGALDGGRQGRARRDARPARSQTSRPSSPPASSRASP